MWIFTKYGFISAVCARQGAETGYQPDPALIMIRARLKEHLEGLMDAFPHIAWLNADNPTARAKNPPLDAIRESPANDYRFRAYLYREEFGTFMAGIALGVDYCNFKSEVRKVDGPSAYEHSLHRVWGVMYGLQCSAYGSGIYSRKEPDETEIDFTADEPIDDGMPSGSLLCDEPTEEAPSPDDDV